jgi:16S rRNA (adenine1518-N6/adenine1519-N6)-dimethyltransferase
MLPPLRQVVHDFAISPTKSLGQNFLFDLNLTAKIARSAGDLTGTYVLEIGPGPGGLTRSLLDSGAKKLIVIERDHRCIGALEQIAAHYGDRLQIINGDALQIKEEEILPEKAKIVANLPYNIATILLIKWLDKLELFTSLTLMFQKEVADRIKASPGNKDYGRLSVITQNYCQVEHQLDINPSSFVPPPKVVSSVINIVPRPQPLINCDKKILEQICKITFNQRRKILRSSLKQLVKDPEALVEGSSISLLARPEELTVIQFGELANLYQNYLQAK